jgi:hypothetical protein
MTIINETCKNAMASIAILCLFIGFIAGAIVTVVLGVIIPRKL